jgi:hypothetical protein
MKERKSKEERENKSFSNLGRETLLVPALADGFKTFADLLAGALLAFSTAALPVVGLGEGRGKEAT